MEAKRLLAEGELSEAIEQLERDIEAGSDDVEGRTFLFELLGFAGELDRAERQLEEIERLDPRPEARTGLQAYRVLLQAERARGRLFHGDGVPRFFSEPHPAVALHLEALRLLQAGLASEARETLDRAASLRSRRRGVAGGVVLDAISDADDLLAPVLEVVTVAGYHWVAWDDVQFLLVPPPQHLRDLLWTPARLATHDGLLGEVYLMNLYPASHSHPDQAVRLGRVTVWSDTGSCVVRGAGQKLIVAGEEHRTFFEIGEVQFLPEADGDISASLATEGLS